MKSLSSQAHSRKNSTELGKVIEEVEQLPVGLTTVVATFLLLVSLVLGSLHFGLEMSLRNSAGLAVIVSALCVIYLFPNRLWGKTGKRILRVHENGVSVVQSDASTTILYCELDEYSCKKTNYSYWDYFELELKSGSCGSPRKINWISTCDAADFDALHVRISGKVAEYMAERLELEHRIPWGASAFICDNGIEARVKTGGVFTSETRFVPWSEFRDMKFCDAKLLLSFEPGNWNVRIPCSEPNVFAGYLLVAQQLETIYGDWKVDRQTEEEIAVAMTDYVDSTSTS